MNDRNLLRNHILELRNALPLIERHAKSLLILKKLLEVEEFQKSRTIFTYVNFRSEVETIPLIRHCLQHGQQVTVPFTDRQAKRLMPYRIIDPEAELAPGYCGIPEPDPFTAATIDPKIIDAVILPGSVFDLRGGRLGYGGGYYDRFLANDAPQALRIGVAFEIQVIDSVPTMPHDQPMDYLITEARNVKINR